MYNCREASYYRQLSKDIKMKNYKTKTSFVIPKGLVQANTTGMIFIIIPIENCLQYKVINDFTVCLRTGSNPVDVNCFKALIGKNNYLLTVHL